MPVLIMWGDRDGVIPVANADRFHTAIPGSDLRIYKNVGHQPQEEASEQSARDIALFINGLKQGRFENGVAVMTVQNTPATMRQVE